MVKLRFRGIDAFDYLRVEGNVQGSLPPLAGRDSEVELADYSEDFTEVRPGLITSATSSRHELCIRGNTLSMVYMGQATWDNIKILGLCSVSICKHVVSVTDSV